MHLLVFTLDDQYFGLPLSVVTQVTSAVEITHLPHSPSQCIGAINLHGEITPVFSMRRLLGLREKEIDLTDQFVICNLNKKIVGLWIDNAKSVSQFTKSACTSGGELFPKAEALEHVIKNDSQIILVYDIERLLPLEVLKK